MKIIKIFLIVVRKQFKISLYGGPYNNLEIKTKQYKNVLHSSKEYNKIMLVLILAIKLLNNMIKLFVHGLQFSKKLVIMLEIIVVLVELNLSLLLCFQEQVFLNLFLEV